MELKVLDKPDSDWDNRVDLGNGYIYQTTAYAKYLEVALGMKNEFLLAIQDNAIVGQLVVSYAPMFSKYLKDRHEKIFKWFDKSFRTIHFIKGPVIFSKLSKKEVYNLFLDYINQKGKKCYMAQDLSLPIEEDKEIYEIFTKKGFYQDKWGTYLVDLTQPIETLWSNLSKTRRNLINRAEKEVEIKEAVSREQREIVIDIIEDMSKRNKIFAHPRKYYHDIMEILGNEGLMKTFYIEKDGKGIATVSVYLFHGRAIQTLVAHSDYGLEQKIGTDYLEWFIITWAKRNGYSTYDLAGIRPSSSDKKDMSLKEYKSRWGGKEVHYPYFSKYYSKKFIIVNPIKKLTKKWILKKKL